MVSLIIDHENDITWKLKKFSQLFQKLRTGMQVEKWQLGHLGQTLQKLFGFKQKILIVRATCHAGSFLYWFFLLIFHVIYKTQKTVFDLISKRREESQKCDAH